MMELRWLEDFLMWPRPAIARVPWKGGIRLRLRWSWGIFMISSHRSSPTNVDLMICYHHAQQPIHLDADRYERVTLGTELLRPDASEALAAKGGASLPGRASHPVPLLMYSPGARGKRRGLVNGGHRGGLWPQAADPDRRTNGRCLYL
jgi:hypothetical protein